MSQKRVVFGVCPHDCPDTCALETVVSGNPGDEQIVEIKGGSHPLTDGWLCAKVRPYREWVEHEERIQTPLRRIGAKGEGRFEPIDWPTALDAISQQVASITSRYGGEAILPYSYSGTLGLLQMSVCNERLWPLLGASQLTRSICGAAAETAVKETLGARWSPSLETIADAKVIVLWGHNPASTAPHTVPLIRRAQKAGATVVVIDPRRSLTARSADIVINPRPASDGVFALGLMHELRAAGAFDDDFLSSRCEGTQRLHAAVDSFPAERAADVCDIEASALIDLAQLIAKRTPTLFKIADGLQRHVNGGQTISTIACLPAVLGQYGVRGGGLMYSTSGYLSWDEHAVRGGVNAPATRSVNMNRLGAALLGEVSNPPIKMLYVFGANPLASTPNAEAIAAGLQRSDLFTVVHELFMTDTARFADIVLPATSQLEHVDVHKAYGQTTVQFNQPALSPRGEAKSNWDTLRAIATTVGINHDSMQPEGEEVLRRIFDATKSSAPDGALSEIEFDQLKRSPWLRLKTPDVPFRDRFATPSGKARLLTGNSALDFASPPETNARHDGSLMLVTPAAHHFVSSSMGGIASLRKKEGTPKLQIHPFDADARDIATGDHVIVENARGQVTLTADVGPAVRPGVVSCPKGHWRYLQADGRNANSTTPDRLGDRGGQATFQSNRVWLKKA